MNSAIRNSARDQPVLTVVVLNESQGENNTFMKTVTDMAFISLETNSNAEKVRS